MKYFLLSFALFVAACSNSENMGRTSLFSFGSGEVNEAFVLQELERNLNTRGVKIDTVSMKPVVLLGDLNNDGKTDAVVRFWEDDPQVREELGKSAMYSLHDIAVLLNEGETMNLTDFKTFDDVLSLSTHDDFDNEKLVGNTYQLTYKRSRQFDAYLDVADGFFEEKPMKFEIVNGKFAETPEVAETAAPSTSNREPRLPTGYRKLTFADLPKEFHCYGPDSKFTFRYDFDQNGYEDYAVMVRYNDNYSLLIYLNSNNGWKLAYDFAKDPNSSERYFGYGLSRLSIVTIMADNDGEIMAYDTRLEQLTTVPFTKPKMIFAGCESGDPAYLYWQDGKFVWHKY